MRLSANRANPGIKIVEDHHEAYFLWKRYNFKDFTLIHLDAHLDFGFTEINPPLQTIKEARNLAQLKNELEKAVLFRRLDLSFDKLTNIGNYIYPAIRDGIIKKFYWIIPGKRKEFRTSIPIIKKILRALAKRDPFNQRHIYTSNNLIKSSLYGIPLVITHLENLPYLNEKTLLDIDLDYLTTDSIKEVSPLKKIAKRRVWVYPKELINYLKTKLPNISFTTIAYSVNGGFTPIHYKYLGDELAWRLAPNRFKRRLKRNFRVAQLFNLFNQTNKKEYYQKAVKLNPSYRFYDNNLGPFYLKARRFSRAEAEFKKIVKVDPNNHNPLLGLGRVSLAKGDYNTANIFFSRALRNRPNLTSALSGLAQAQFHLGNYSYAKRLFRRFISLEPLQPQALYFLGRIYEKRGAFLKAVQYYKDSLRFGFSDIDALLRLLKVSKYLNGKFQVPDFATKRFRNFKREFLRNQRLSKRNKNQIFSQQRLRKKIDKTEALLKACGVD